MIRVVIADDHQLVRQGVTLLLLKATDIEVVGEARDGLEALQQVERLQPDIILMDIEMPRLDGLTATSQLIAAGCNSKVIILSMKCDEEDVRSAAHIGAHGYLIKDSNRDELIAGIRSVYGGERVCSPLVAPYFSDQPG